VRSAPYTWRRGGRFVTGLASKLLGQFVSGFASKPLGRFVSGLTSKLVVMVFSDLASKPVATVFPGLASKPVVGFLVESQNQGGAEFFGLGLKTGSYGLVIWSVKPQWWFGPQNHHDGFLVWASKPSRLQFVGCIIKSMGGCDGVRYVLRYSGLFHVEASLARIFQFGFKTNESATTGGARGTTAEVASESS
jgi:hypothetical protein